MNLIKYRTYDPEVRRQITESGNIYLFPELNIPRSTARYWIEKSKSIPTEKSVDRSLQNKILRLNDELIKERQKVMFLEKHIELTGKINENKIKKKDRKAVVGNVLDYKHKVGIGQCLRMIDVSRTAYDRWMLKHHRCKKTRSFICGHSKGNQLTFDEQKALTRMAKSKKYAHMSIRSLYLYCLRKNIICCSLDSWYKYIRLFGIDRVSLTRKARRKYGLGIRASRPNQIWHVDVTQIKLLSGEVVYLQVIIDNHSRYVVSWRLTKSINAKSSVETIRNALEVNSSESLMMDRGTENVNHKVEQILVHQNVKRIISKRDVHWSNSMVEAFFRSLKNNYLYHHVSRSFTELKRRLVFYFKEHNTVIPHSTFDGAVPHEVYNRMWSGVMKNNLLENIKTSLKRRVEINRLSNCCRNNGR